jgi:hypothetical protein
MKASSTGSTAADAETNIIEAINPTPRYGNDPESGSGVSPNS